MGLLGFLRKKETVGLKELFDRVQFVDKIDGEDRIIKLFMDEQVPVIYGLGVSGRVYKLDRFREGAWEIMADNPPMEDETR